jgi:hypothetical protein
LVASLTLAQWGTNFRPDASFYLLPTRGWELLIGAFSAFFLQNQNSNCKVFKKVSNEFYGFLGVFLIFFSVFFFSKSTPFPGFYALVPTLGTVMIIFFATKETYVGKFLGSKPLVGFGLISYSTYLWHQPVFAFSRYYFLNFDKILIFSSIFCTYIISILSWKFIEIPFRQKDKISKNKLFLTSMIFIFIFIVTGHFASKIDYRREEAMAKALLLSPAIFSSNIDERIFIKNRILYEDIKPDSIVIGSSRLMQASSEGSGFNLLNLSVSGASLEDLLAIWELSSSKFNPSYILLGADPWIFNHNSNQDRWISLGFEYSIAMAKLGLTSKSILPEKKPSYSNTIALRFFNSVNQSKIRSDNDLPTLTDKIRRDGSRVYNLSYANKSIDDVERGALNYLSYGMANYSYSNQVRVTLERFVNQLKSQNLRVVFVLSPYHPKLFEFMRQEDRKFLEIESIFREIAELSGVQVIGSYDPIKVGCSSEDFYDGMHPKDKCLDQIFSELRK